MKLRKIKFDKKTYNRIHVWNLRNWTKTGVCEKCKQNKKTVWSNKSAEYRYKDKTDWQELCHKCHTAYDREVLGVMAGSRGKGNLPEFINVDNDYKEEGKGIYTEKLNLWVTPTIKEKLEKEAKEQDISIAQLIRNILETYYNLVK